MDIAGVILLAMVVVLGAFIALLWLISRVVQDGRRISELQARIDQLDAALYRLKRESVTQPPIKPVAPEQKPAPAPEPPVMALHIKKPTPQEFVVSREAVIPPPPEVPKPVEPPPPISEPVPVLIPPPIAEPQPAFKSQEPAPATTPPLISEPASIPVPPFVAETQPAFKTEEPAPIPSTLAAPPGKGSFEMRLGTYWLVRIGIVMLLTGVVFFGNYAYHNFIGKLGPGGKIGLLYLASFTILGVGAWWQRKETKEALRNWAQVVFAGGLALVYFTTYFAHIIPTLCVIPSALMDGALLVGWAGFIVWIADRKKSEVLALFAVVLAYYASVITTVGGFTLYSNLILTLVAVIFLVRNRWAGLTVATLVGSYASYAFWRFFHHGEWHWANPDEGLWFGAYFLGAYWVMFTVAGFLSQHKNLSGTNRAAFLTLNNGAFFTLFILTMFEVRTGKFWEFALGYGAALLILTALARRVHPAEPSVKNAYLTQGLLLVTIGFITKYSGFKLGLLLGAESVVLYVLATQRGSLIMRLFAYACAAMAVGWSAVDLERFDPKGIWVGAGLGAMLAFNAVWAHRKQKDVTTPMRAEPTYFSLLAILAWAGATWLNTHREIFPLALAIEALVLTLSIYALRVRELTLLAQLLIAAAQGCWVANHFLDPVDVPWWNPALLIGITLGLSHWWQHQKVLVVEKAFSTGCQAIYSAAVVGVVYFWLQPLTGAPDWLALTSLLAIGVTAYGVFTRSWALAICGQFFLAVSIVQFFLQLADGKPLWYFPLAPVAALGLLSFATLRWFAAKPDSTATVRDPLLQIALVYRWSALCMSLGWVEKYVPEHERVWVFMTLGALVFAFAGWRRNVEAIMFGAVYSIAGIANLWALGTDDLLYLPNLAGLLVLLAQQQVARRLPARYPPQEQFHAATIIVGCLMLWRYASCWVMQVTPEQYSSYFPASWSVLALIFFIAGFLLKERVYHWTGLAVLAAAFGKLWLSPADEWLKLVNLLPVLLLLVQQQLDRRSPKRFAAAENIDAVKIVVGSVTLWRYVSCWVMQSQSGFYLTASWSVLAFVLFAAGMLLTERVYRWTGLGILAAALGRVVVFDVWKQETIYRVLTFMALGVVLMALGFLYNKYQDKIRKWL